LHFPASIPLAKTIKQMKMLNDYRIDCVDSITFGISRAGGWRRGVAARYTADQRNIRAAEALEKIANEKFELTDSEWAALAEP
jgi:hypothetical protein